MRDVKIQRVPEAACVRRTRGVAACAAVLAALVAAMLLALSSLVPASFADEQEKAVAHSQDGTTTYYSIDKAWEAARLGTVIVMDDDWLMTSPLTCSQDQSAYIMMNGHKIYRVMDGMEDDGNVVRLCKNASLTLDGTGAQTTFTYKKFSDADEAQVTCGGLVCGGRSSNSAGGVEMDEGCTLKLINVAVAGNKTEYHGGGVAMNGADCTLEMTDALIAYNDANTDKTIGLYIGCGGGVYINNERGTVTMTRSSIDYNQGDLGGGIYSDSGSTKITMKDHSSLDYNRAHHGLGGESSFGGALYFNRSFFTVEGDGTASISHNSSVRRGAAIYIEEKTTGNNEGTIKGIAFNENYSCWAGAIWVEQENVTIENCTFFRNNAEYDGGVIYIENDNTTLRGCTFTRNSTGDYGGAVYIDAREKGTLIDGCTMINNTAGKEGGAVWTSAYNDIKLAGTVVVKGNKRTGGAADDIFLNTLSGGGAKAYLTGSLEKGSKVGVRTGDTGNRLLAQKFSDNGGFSLFSDLAGYYVTYGSDHDGDAWQRQGTAQFQFSVDGTTLGVYKQDDSVSASAMTGDAAKAFWRWSEESSFGLAPFADYVPDPTARTVSFPMPQNNVSLVGEYIARTGSVALTVDAPRIGEELPSTGTLSWLDAEGAAQEKEVAVSWLEVASAGTVTAEGVAKPGATYAVSAIVPMDGQAGLAFALYMSATDVAVSLREGEGELVAVGASSASVDAETEELTLVSEGYTLPRLTLASVEPAAITASEGATETDLRALLPTTALGADSSGAKAALVVDASSADLSALLSDGYVIVPEGGTATVKLAVSAEGVDNPDGVELEVTVTVEPTYLQVEFDAADGTPAPAAQTVRWGTCAQGPTAPQLAGYTFQGWYAQGADAAWDFKTPVTSALALTAKWEPVMLSVTFDAAGGAPAPETQSVKWGEQAQEPAAPTWEGHTFLGWYAQDAEVAWDFKTPVTSALALTAKWEPVVLSVTFDAAGGAPAPQAQSVTWGEQAQEPEKPVWEGHTFLGWYAQDAEEAWGFTTPVTSTLALTAKWELVMYDVDFAYANGQGAERVTVAHGSALTAPAAPTRTGYAFLGWYTDSGTRYNFSTPVTSSFALTAWWTPTPTTFIDVEEGSWYEGWVSRAASLGLMSGYTDGVGAFTGYFGPEDALTRGQVATVLWRMARAPKPQGTAPFPEDDVVPGMYYYQAVAWCCEQGIITGYESGDKAGTFRPSDPVSREELALMVARFERWAGVDTSDAPTANFERCTDAASVSDWAADAVTWTAAAGVLGGKEIPGEPGTTTYRLDPQQGATRAQAAKVFARAWEIQHGEEPYEAQALAEETAQATGDTAAQEATFDDVTFEDVAAEGVQTSEVAAEEAQVAGDEGTATDPMASEQQVAEDTHAAAEAQDADEDAPQFEFDTEPSSESSDSPTEDATYAQAA